MANIKDSRIAKLFYNFPGAVSAYHFLWAWTGATLYRGSGKKVTVIGVTGTKGKTTTLELVNAIFEHAGKRTALLSSLRVKVGENSAKNQLSNSMPGRGFIQNFLRSAGKNNCEFALIEVTSQGVVLHRHRFVHWDIGVMTNLAPEHIESHGSFENYRAAKLAFLNYVFRRGGEVFLNRDDKNFDFLFGALSAQRTPIVYSKEDELMKTCMPRIRAARAAVQPGEARMLLSEFNEENIAVAAAVAKRFGIDEKIIEEAVLNFNGVPGRMEFVKRGAFTGVVDYAHTPDSLEAAYKAVKPIPSAEHPAPRLICVLGAAGGGRDKWKRPAMGAVAAAYCDEIVLTDEDPYEEDGLQIIKEIQSGIPENAAHKVQIVLNRKDAIQKAFALAQPGDVVIGTGKGSEDWIHLGHGKKISWSEREVFEEAIGQRA